MCTEGPFTGLKRPECEADQSSPTSEEFKIMWIYTSTPSYVFVYFSYTHTGDSFVFGSETFEEKQEVLGRTDNLFSFDIQRGRHRKQQVKNISMVACIFLPIRCLAAIGEYTYTQTDG
jgi:hypothetical protein